MSGRSALFQPLTGALVLFNFCFASLLLYHAWIGTQASTLLAVPPKGFVMPAPDIIPPVRRESFAGIQDQSLFYASRHFYAPPPPSAVPPTPSRPDYQLAGVFVIPSRPTIALLRNAAGASRKVRTGDDLDGWQVAAIESTKVLLEYQGQTAEIAGAGKSVGRIQVVPLARNSQPAAAQSVGIRTLGSGTPAMSASPSVFGRPSVQPRLYRPSPQ